MYKNSVMYYLENRRLGYGGPNKTYDLFINQLSYPKEIDDILLHSYMHENGLISAWKFCKNKSNLHLLGGSSYCGKMYFQNTTRGFECPYAIQDFKRTTLIPNCGIFNFAWAEPHLKLIMAYEDKTSRLCTLLDSGKLVIEKEFPHNSRVQSVMFCPGSSNLICGSSQDGSIKVFDARECSNKNIYDFENSIDNAHGINRPIMRRQRERVVLSNVIFQDENKLISCYSMDRNIKVWDLRKNHSGSMKCEPLIKYQASSAEFNLGYTDIIMNPQGTLLYAHGTDNVIYCFPLGSTYRAQISQYSGHKSRTAFPKISINHDGRYLFAGCMRNGGLLWCTDYPFNDKPILKMGFSKERYLQEQGISDWCADPSNIKLLTSAEAMPMVWTLSNTRGDSKIKFLNTKTFIKRPPNNKRKYTQPIKVKAEVRNDCMKQTEEDMEDWDVPIASDIFNLPSCSNS